MRTGDKVNRYLVTTFDENYFLNFGISWFGSLFDISKFDGVVIAIVHDFKKQEVLNLLKEKKINIIIAPEEASIVSKRTYAYFKIAELQRQNKGLYAYYDFDGYFNGNINDVFDLYEPNKFLRTENNNDGFVCGDYQAWNDYYDFLRFEKFCQFPLSTEYFFFGDNNIKWIDNKFNFVDIARITPETEVKFIHYAGMIKKLLNTNYDYNFHFSKKHPEVCKKWTKIFNKKQSHVKRKLISKNKDNHEKSDTDLGQ